MNQLTNTNKIKIIDVLKIAGTWSALFMGAGFATGAEMFQYFLPWGEQTFFAIIFGMAIVVFVAASFMKAASEENFKDPNDIIYYYAGPIGGKVLLVCSLLIMISIPMAITAGFGATLTTLTGLPTWLGSIIMGTACLITVLLGLHRIVDITGTMGPFILMIAVSTSLYLLVQNNFEVAAGIAIAPELSPVRIGTSWWMAGILYSGWVPLFAAPYLIAAASTVENKKSAFLGVILGTFFLTLCIIVMCLAFFTDYETLLAQATPNIYIAKQISPILGTIFVLVVFCAVYSSTAPPFYTFCRTVATEKTLKYTICAIVVITASTTVSIFVPFGTLFNIIFSIFGYLGIIFEILIVVKYITKYIDKKKVS